MVFVENFRINDKNYPNVISSEGGSIGMPIRDDLDDKLYRYLIEKLEIQKDEFIKAEWLCGGMGLPYIYSFFREIILPGYSENASLRKLGNKKTGRDIFEVAKMDSDPIALATLKCFISLVGLACHEYALVCRTIGGIVLVGNIFFYIREFLLENYGNWDKNPFLKAFLGNQPDNQEFLKQVPVFLCTEKELGIQGCIYYHNNNKFFP